MRKDIEGDWVNPKSPFCSPFIKGGQGGITVFLLALAWFTLFQPWGSFNDPDAFYHAKMASLISEQGIIREFPWLDLTSFAKPFANHHFLFHVALVPFVKIFGMLAGTQIAGVVFAAGFITLFYVLLRRLEIRRPELWTGLLLVLPPIIIRMSLAKASPFAVGLTCVGVIAILLRKPLWGFVAGFLFVLFHGGWLILPALQVLTLVGMTLYDAVVEDKGWKIVPEFRVLAATTLGIALSLLVHPYNTTILPFLWIQLVKIGIATPIDRVSMGQEWYPYTIRTLVPSLGAMLFAYLFVGYGFLFTRRLPFDRSRARQVMGLLLPTGALLVLTLKSMRFSEYLTPLAVILAAVLFACVDEQRLVAEFRRLRTHAQRSLGALAVVVTITGVTSTWLNLYKKAMPFGEYSKAMAVVAAHVPAGSRIFHSDWSLFPQLFALDDRYRYVAGLDPAFLLEANPALSDAYTGLRLGTATTTAYALVHDQLGARAALIEVKGNEHMIEAFENDSRFERVHQDTEAYVYLVGE